MTHQQMGFSTGSLYRAMDTYSQEAIKKIGGLSTDAIEVMCAHAEDIDRLPAMIPWLTDFKTKSVHLPVNLRYQNTSQVRQLLGRTSAFYHAIGASLAVLHPDLVDDWSVFDDSPMNIAIENMDCRKNSFQFTDDLSEAFTKHPRLLFVLDLNHCFSNDPSMALADELMRLFGDRLAEVHISGFDGKYHSPLFRANQPQILDHLPETDCPIIIESPCDFDELAQEISYIRQ